MPKTSQRALDQRRQILRDALRANPEGLTIPNLMMFVPRVDDRVLYHDLTVMPDTYIDRWVKNPHRGAPFLAVWCAVVPPPNCPRPALPNYGARNDDQTDE